MLLLLMRGVILLQLLWQMLDVLLLLLWLMLRLLMEIGWLLMLLGSLMGVVVQRLLLLCGGSVLLLLLGERLKGRVHSSRVRCGILCGWRGLRDGCRDGVMRNRSLRRCERLLLGLLLLLLEHRGERGRRSGGGGRGSGRNGRLLLLSLDLGNRR